MFSIYNHVHSILQDIKNLSSIESSANRLDTEQEREQEQEQEKEVEAKKEKHIEIERFIEREYTRQEEFPRSWPFKLLSRSPPKTIDPFHPFFPLKDFKLRFQDVCAFPSNMYLSSNFFCPDWKGLRRVKNVVMVSITGILIIY